MHAHAAAARPSRAMRSASRNGPWNLHECPAGARSGEPTGKAGSFAPSLAAGTGAPIARTHSHIPRTASRIGGGLQR